MEDQIFSTYIDTTLAKHDKKKMYNNEKNEVIQS